jgi:hypothetical protein
VPAAPDERAAATDRGRNVPSRDNLSAVVPGPAEAGPRNATRCGVQGRSPEPITPGLSASVRQRLWIPDSRFAASGMTTERFFNPPLRQANCPNGLIRTLVKLC